jgi:hypothetical protein
MLTEGIRSASDLMGWEHERLCHDYMFPSSSCKHNHLRNIIRCEGLASTTRRQLRPALSLRKESAHSHVNLVRFRLVEAVPNGVELLRNLSKSAQTRRFVNECTVRTCPGSTLIILILVPTSSLLNASPNARTAALLAQYIYSNQCHENSLSKARDSHRSTNIRLPPSNRAQENHIAAPTVRPSFKDW